MSLTIKIEKFDANDLDSLKALLVRSELPVDDLSSRVLDHFFVIRSTEGTVIATIGLEAYRDAGLLRSLAVDTAYRDQGLGEALVNHLEAYARQLGIRQLYLLTTTAETYFRKLDYSDFKRTEAPAAIQATREFSTLCPASAVCLYKTTG